MTHSTGEAGSERRLARWLVLAAMVEAAVIVFVIWQVLTRETK
jgi:hypothetical protein